MKSKILFLVLFLFGIANLFATTWDEPWADKVIKEADYFVLAEILPDSENGVKIKIIRQLGGDKLPTEIEITNFYLLGLTSFSHGVGFEFGNVEQSYLFLKKNDKGEFCIATPTTFDAVRDENVYATYRHSYHQALVPIDIYEMTMSAIFNNYHKLPYDKKKITDFIDEQLSKKTAGFDKDEINTFFLQHVSLETIFHLRLDGYYDKIVPFLNDNSNFHNRVAAARALIAYNNSETKKLLLNKIANNKNDDFVTVICIWTLKEFQPKELKSDLQKLVRKASTKDNGFGGNIMDPRVGTTFPNVKRALTDLINSL